MADPSDRGESATSTRFYAAVAFGVAALIVGIFAFRSRTDPTPTLPIATRDAAPEPWCAAGLEPIDGGGCFAVPPGKGRFPLLIYLHGLHTPATIAEEQERQGRVAKRALERGFGVLALHGEKGACSNTELVDTFCWPSNERTAERAQRVVADWSAALEKAKNRGATAQKYLLGFSNGGYFAGLLTTRHLLVVDAAVIAHAGAVGQVRFGNWIGPIPPILLETADDDTSNGEMIAFDAQLTREKWPHVIAAREGGHTINDWNIDTALTFFTRVSSEAWPLNPPLAVRAPKPPKPAEDAGDTPDAARDATPTNAVHEQE